MRKESYAHEMVQERPMQRGGLASVTPFASLPPAFHAATAGSPASTMLISPPDHKVARCKRRPKLQRLAVAIT